MEPVGMLAAKSSLLGSALRIGGVLIALYVLVCVGARLVSTGMLFPAPYPSYGPKMRGLTTIRGENGAEYAAVYLPHEKAKQLILFFHGNGEDLGKAFGRIEGLHLRGFAVLAVDYPGYGMSLGKPTEEGFYASADAAFRHATELLGWSSDNIIAHGVSLGGAGAMWVGSRRPVGGLIMESSFMSAYRVMTGSPIVLGDRMPNLKRMASVRCPVLVIHGIDDRLISWEHGRRLLEAAPEPKQHFWVSGAGHNNVISTAKDAYWRSITDFAAGLE